MRFITSTGYLILVLVLFGCAGQSASSNTDTKSTPEVLISENYDRVNLPGCTTGNIETVGGSLCGKAVTTSSGGKVNAYLGIPFAESPSGDNRWRPPVPLKGWNGVLKATELGPSCPQLASIAPQSEDCLTINVWVPQSASKEPRAVMVFIYGGAFIYGSSAEPTYDGAYASARGDLVVVSFNYRIGALGFLAGVKDKDTGEEVNGNFGFLDQILALKWVQQNIAAFGGDPEKVTLWGESAGAMSIGLHLVSSPASKGLYRAGVMESNPLGIPYKTLKESRSILKHFAKTLGCSTDDIGCMRGKLPEVVLDAQSQKNLMMSTFFHGIADFLSWAPVVDGEVITAQPITGISGGKLNVPIIIGTNKNEGLLFVELTKAAIGKKSLSPLDYRLSVDLLIRDHEFRKKVYEKYPAAKGDNTNAASKLITDYLFVCPTRYAAKNASPNTWAYSFDHVSSFNYWTKTPSCAEAVCHAAELPYVFHTAKNKGFSFTPEESRLSDLMIDYWTSFAKDLVPRSEIVKWPEFGKDSERLVFVTPVDNIEPVSDLEADCALWDETGYDLRGSFWGMF